MNYARQIQKVIDYIGQHLDDRLSLEQLSQVACFSKYHFHRLFTVQTGLSLQQYIRWLRLKRAAHQLVVDKGKSIIDIAIDAGFESHEAFSRVFKQTTGVSPSAFKTSMCWQAFETPPYRLPETSEATMHIEIKEKKERRLAVVEHRGDPASMGESVNKLIGWSKAQPIDLKPKAGEAFGFAYDDPKTTAPADFRFDLAITVPANLKLDGDVYERYLPTGRYAVALHKGSRNNIDETIYAMYRDWLPVSGEALGDLPCLFSYLNFDHEVADTELLTECWMLLE